jgi:hypothetical protein
MVVPFLPQLEATDQAADLAEEEIVEMVGALLRMNVAVSGVGVEQLKNIVLFLAVLLQLHLL